MDDPWLMDIGDLEGAINAEMDNWQKIGAHPSGVNTDNFLLDMLINSLRNFLIKTGVIDEEEFFEYYRRHTLEQMQAIRTQIVEPAMAEMRKEQIRNGINPNAPRRKH